MSKDQGVAQSAPNGWNLTPLTPAYSAEVHAGYVSALEAALEDDQVLNIALSGNYGVGKSSILRGLAESKGLEGRVVELSLSTLAPIEATTLDDTVPKHATTPTNRIQQEIVKQLLYREAPGKMSGSRFERIERFRWRREVGGSGLAGLIVAVVFLLTGWSAQIAREFQPLVDTSLWIHLIVLLAATGAIFGARWLTYGRLHIKQFSAGTASVTLDDRSVSYFDQYLDEIVHFFEVSNKQDVVIFEDIDRFNDSHIFETLRSLNTLLNGAPQIKKKIRFIYAIKDSIFDKIGLEGQGRPLDRSILDADDPALAETIRANRTKFFDLVIPVVPFITHRSARNLAAQLLGEVQHEVHPDLLDLATQYVPDMRLLINVRNEFIVFRDRIFSGDGEKLDLSETVLFAMMLYKSVHLSDFEAIRIGKSQLDTLYSTARRLVVGNIDRLVRERRMLQRRIWSIDGATSQSDRLGRLLISHINRTARSAGVSQQDTATFTFGAANLSEADLKGAAFWREFASADDEAAVLRWNARHNRYGTLPLTFFRQDIAASLGDPIDTQTWDESAREEWSEEIDEKAEAIAFLRSADMGALIQRPEFQVDHAGEMQSLDAVARDVLAPGLAYQLVRSGFIDRDFTLYTSTFHGDRVSTASTNFIIHHVERDSMDVHFELTPDDVDMVIRERGTAALEEPALYNIAILDHLLASKSDTAGIMIRSLARLSVAQYQFLQAYLESGQYRKELIKQLTPIYYGVLAHLVNQVELDESLRLELVDTVLGNLAAGMKYRTDEATSTYLLEHYTKFPTVFGDETTTAQATRISDLLVSAGVVLPTLAPSRETLRRELVARNLYQITLTNLMVATGSGSELGLDSLSRKDATVYQYCLDNLPAYLNAINEDRNCFSTIDKVEGFATVLEEVLECDHKELLDPVVAGASKECIVSSLNDVAEGAWLVLAKYQRFPATFENVTRYIESVGSIDESLAAVLSDSSAVSGVDVADEAAKEALAKTIVSASVVLPTADIRARLAESLALEDYLHVDDIPAEKGELFACLRKRNVIADEAASYQPLATTDWSTREAFIQVSEEFSSYVSPELVEADLAPMLLSAKVSDRVKQAILNRADDFVASTDAAGLNALAKLAIQQGETLSEELVVVMARGGVPAQQVMVLLETHLATIAHDLLFVVLRSLGGDYPKLTSVGYDRPKIPNTEADRALMDRLQRDGIVSKYDPSASLIKVTKRRKVR